MKTTAEKIVLVTRPTRMAGLKRKFGTKMQAQFYVERMRADFQDYENEDNQYESAIEQVSEILSRFRRVQKIDRSYLPNFLFDPEDIVVALGQDGLVANTLKYLDGQPLVGVNPDPKRWDGVLLPFNVQDLEKIMPEIQAGKRPVKNVTMAEARLSTQQSLFAVNDFFVGTRGHASARYQIRVGPQLENHSSSGVIVSTGLGSTGWLRSVVEGARQITSLLGQTAVPAPKPAPPDMSGHLALRRRVRSESPSSGSSSEIDSSSSSSAPAPRPRIPWDAPYLTFSVREPFPSRNTQTQVVFGRVDEKSPLLLSSLMPEDGVIFSDGVESDFLEFASGTEATILPAKRQGHLVV